LSLHVATEHKKKQWQRRTLIKFWPHICPEQWNSDKKRPWLATTWLSGEGDTADTERKQANQRETHFF
jgi:hypothetical protein